MNKSEYLQQADSFLFENENLKAKAKEVKDKIEKQIKNIQKSTDELYNKALKGDTMSVAVMEAGLEMLNKLSTQKSDSKEVKAFLQSFVK
jgi:spore coat protein CotF